MRKITVLLGNISHSKFFIRVFFSVILIALIVAFVFSAIIYTRFISQQKKDKIISLDNDVKTVSQNINKRIEDMLRIVINIDTNSEFFSYPINNNIETQRDAMVSELNKYTIGNRFIRDLGYYRISEPQLIYSNQGKMDIDMFFKHIYRYKEITGDKFKNMIKGKNIKVIPVADVNFTSAPAQIITFVFGLPFAIPEPSRNVIFFVNKTQIDDIVNDTMSGAQDNLFIFDENNTPIYALKDNNQRDAVMDYLANKDENLLYTNTEYGTNFLYIKNKSDYSGWTIVTVYETKKVLYDYYFNRNFLFLVVGLIILIIITAAVLIAFYNYKPLYILMQKISGSNNPHANYDEIEHIEAIVENEINKKLLLQKRLFLSNLIWGQFEDSNSLHTSMMEANILFNYKSYIACCVYYLAEHNDAEDINVITQADKIMSAIERIFDLSDTQAMCVDLNDKSSIAVVINYQGGGACREKISSIFKELIDDALLSCNTYVSVGIGNEYKNDLQIEQSYQQAWQAVFFGILNDEKFAVYEYNDECAKIDLPNYFKMNIARAIKQDNKDMAMDKISQLVDQLYQDSKNTKSIKNIYYRVFEYLTNLCYKLNLDSNDEIIRNSKRILSNPTYSIEQIYQSMEMLCSYICRSSQGISKVNNNTELKEKILAIIHDNLCDNTLSLEMIADECNITPSYLVRYFKTQTGHSPMQYVDMKRMEHAKNLLVTTDFNLKQIVTQTGYIDESNFIRKFKKIEQITPIKYRKNYQV